jgi:hypothetical protein
VRIREKDDDQIRDRVDEDLAAARARVAERRERRQLRKYRRRPGGAART